MAQVLPFYTDVRTSDAEQQFLMQNAFAHDTAYQFCLGQGITTEHYPLWDFGANRDDWFMIHYSEHVSLANALNIAAPPDLSTVNWNDMGQRTDWLQMHADHHTLIELAVGV